MYQQGSVAGTPYQQPSSSDEKLWCRDPAIKVPIVNAILNFVLPGLGSMLGGQVTKGLMMLVTFILGHILCNFIAIIPFLGWIAVLPLHAIWTLSYRIGAAHDAFVIASRFQQGYPVMQGECGNILATILVSLVVQPCFITGTAQAPLEWHNRVSQYGYQ